MQLSALSRMRRIRISSVVTWSCRGSAPRASTSSIPSRTREIRSIVHVIEPEEIAAKTGYSRPHTIHCGPDAIYVSALGAPNGDGPGGIFLLDYETFDVLGRWEVDRGPQYLAYDFWWHLGCDVAVTSEWGTPNMIENGVHPDLLLGGKYGHAIHIWDLRKRRHLQASTSAPKIRWRSNCAPRTIRPSSTASAASSSRPRICRPRSGSGIASNGGNWAIQKVIEVPAEPADPDKLPPALKPFKAVPPLITDINLTLDDKFLYVSCFGTGDLRQYDVSDPFHPKLTGWVRLGGIASHATHPKSGPLNGGAQMVEISRDGKRIYLTNSLYGAWDEQFYPEGLRGWVAKLDANPAGGLESIRSSS